MPERRCNRYPSQHSAASGSGVLQWHCRDPAAAAPVDPTAAAPIEICFCGTCFQRPLPATSSSCSSSYCTVSTSSSSSSSSCTVSTISSASSSSSSSLSSSRSSSSSLNLQPPVNAMATASVGKTCLLISIDKLAAFLKRITGPMKILSIMFMNYLTN